MSGAVLCGDEGGMKSSAAGESHIFLTLPSSLRLAHPPATPVISRRGRVPYGCQEPLSEALSPRRLTRVGGMAPNSPPVKAPLCDVAAQEVGPLASHRGCCSLF